MDLRQLPFPRVKRGKIFLRELGEIEPRGRMVQVLVEVRTPCSGTCHREAAPLFLGSYVSLSLLAGQLEGCEIPRAARTDRGTVWTVTGEKTLQEQAVEVAYESKKSLFIQPTLSADVRIVTSPSRVQWRMEVQLRSDATEAEPETAKSTPEEATP